MGSSNDGSPAAQGAQDTAEGDQRYDDAGPEQYGEQQQRGFFGRLLDAFSPNDDRDDRVVIREEHPGIANLRSLRVDDVAVPKAEIAAVPVEIGLKELVATFREQGYSRLPVFEGSLDNPLGMILLKDLALKHDFTSAEPFDLRSLLRPILFVPPSMAAATLLQKMQRERRHLAMVIDEYGGVDGLLTIEDLIETIIGEIDDEHDEVAGALWIQDKPGSYVVQSRASLDAFEAETGLELRRDDDDEDVNTLGGLIFVRTGRVPRKGEVIEHESGARFEILEGDPRRIKRLRVRMPEAAA